MKTVQDELPQVFIKPMGVIVEIVLKDVILLWTWFWSKMLSKVSIKRVQILIVQYLLGHIL